MTLFVNAVVVGIIIIDLACSLSLTITNVIGRPQRRSRLLTNTLFHKRKRTHIIAVYFLQNNKNYNVERSSKLKADTSSKGSNSSPEVE
jgi:hypothetical protein